MELDNIDLSKIQFYLVEDRIDTMDRMDTMVGIYNQKFLMIYNGNTIDIEIFNPKSKFIFDQKNSIHSRNSSYKNIFDFFFSKYNSELYHIKYDELLNIFKIYNREIIINQIINE